MKIVVPGIRVTKLLMTQDVAASNHSLRSLRPPYSTKSCCKMCVVVPLDLEKGAAALPRFIPQS